MDRKGVCRRNEVLFFFFKQKTAYEMRISDWSSDVCSSDLFGRKVLERQPTIDRMFWRIHRDKRSNKRNLIASLEILPFRGLAQKRTAMEIGRASCRERVCQYV